MAKPIENPSSVATTKQLIDGYMPTLLLALVLFGLCLSSVILAENVIRDDTELHALIYGKFAASQISEIGNDLRIAAQEAVAGSAKRAVNILIGTLVLVTLIAVIAVAGLNTALVRSRRKLKAQTADLRDTKLQKRALFELGHS